jgi:hypothetical protein
MANIPLTTRFIGIADTVNLVEKKSSQINSETEPYTMQDILDTVPAGAQGPQGPQGPVGQTGAQGIQGVDGAVGPAGLNWQGAFVGGTSYVLDDAVSFGGASWFCINPTSSAVTPDINTTDWALLASQGAVGPQGIQGVPGVNGVVAGLANLGSIVEGTTTTGGDGSTSQISGSILVPANTLATNSILETSWGTYRVGTSGIVQSQVYVNTTNSLIGATRIGTGANQQNDGGWTRNIRDFQKIGNTIYGYNFNYQASNDLGASQNVRSQVTIDPTADLYIIFAILRTGIADSATINRVRIVEHF